jgi:hypothetical protein
MGMTLVLIPVTVFSYAPGLIQVPVVINGGCTAVSRGGGALSYKWTFALVNLVSYINVSAKCLLRKSGL